jgi:hypothetical protein
MRHIEMKDATNFRRRILTTLLLITVLVVTASLPCLSHAQAPTLKEEGSSDVLALAAALGSDQNKVRENRAEGIRKVRGQLVDRLIEFAGQPAKALYSPSGERRAYLWHEPKHLAIPLLGDLRASEAASLLLENIEYENPRERFTGMLGPDERYPAAEALSKIGMPAMEPVVFKLSKVDPESKTAGLCCWTVNQILGVKLARTYIQIEIDRALYTPDKENLKASLAYFKPG